MERYKINRNTPKLEAFPIVPIGCDPSYREVALEENGVRIKIPADRIHGISVGDVLCIRKRSGEPSKDVKDWGVYFTADVTVIGIEGDTILLDLPVKKESPVNIESLDDRTLHVIECETEDEPEGTSILTFDDLFGFLPEDFNETDINGWPVSEPDAVWKLKPVYYKRNAYEDAYAPDYDRQNINQYSCGVNNDEAKDMVMPFEFHIDVNPYYYQDGDSCVLFSSVELVRIMSYFEISTKIQRCDETNLLQQNTIEDFFSSEIKSKIIPDFIDMEKMMFEPVMDSSGEVLVEELVFNLHFRERDVEYVKVDEPTPYICNSAGDTKYETPSSFKTPSRRYILSGTTYYELKYTDGWSVNDDGGWNNNIKIGDAITVNNNQRLAQLNSSDLVGYLNFSDEDVRYQKMKLKKSFIRLTFYDSDNPLTQQMLYYSTIFLDSGDLFGKFVKGKNKDKNFGVFSESGETRVSTQVVVKNKYNTDKSSEGFYLYLFNNEAEKGGSSKDIYMKVEFNHAGYGRTLPMIKPYLDDQNKLQKVPFDKYFDSLYIKLGIKQMPTGEANYVYYFDDSNKYGVILDHTNRKIIFNLFEVIME